MVFTRVPDKIKYGELVNNFSIQYAIKNDQYPEKLQEEMYVMHKVKFKAEIIMIKVAHKNRIKMKVVNEINQMRQVLHKRRTMKNVYRCG